MILELTPYGDVLDLHYNITRDSSSTVSSAQIDIIECELSRVVGSCTSEVLVPENRSSECLLCGELCGNGSRSLWAIGNLLVTRERLFSDGIDSDTLNSSKVIIDVDADVAGDACGRRGDELDADLGRNNGEVVVDSSELVEEHRLMSGSCMVWIVHSISLPAIGLSNSSSGGKGNVFSIFVRHLDHLGEANTHRYGGGELRAERSAGESASTDGRGPHTATVSRSSGRSGDTTDIA